MIIVCPNCSTRYEVADQAIGDHGRSVQCASCSRSWHATAVKDKDFENLLLDSLDEPASGKKPKKKNVTPEDEDALDFDFQSEDPNFAAGESSPSDDIDEPEGDEADAARSNDAVQNAVGAAQDVVNAINDDNEVELVSYAARRRQQIERMKRSRRIARRRKEIARALPMARLRRNISYGAIAFTIVFLTGLFGFQSKIVEAYPDLAGFYRLFGQKINVVGLNFADVRVDRIWRDGHEVLTVRVQIVNETNRVISLTPIRVALIGEEDQVLYEWNSTPDLAVLEGNGIFDFETELSSPPKAVARVRLKFLDWQSRGGYAAPKKDYQDVKISNKISKSKPKFTFGSVSVTQDRLSGMAQSKAGE